MGQSIVSQPVGLGDSRGSGSCRVPVEGIFRPGLLTSLELCRSGGMGSVPLEADQLVEVGQQAVEGSRAAARRMLPQKPVDHSEAVLRRNAVSEPGRRDFAEFERWAQALRWSPAMCPESMG